MFLVFVRPLPPPPHRRRFSSNSSDFVSSSSCLGRHRHPFVCLFVCFTKVWRELKISLARSETAALIAWYDRSAAATITPSDLCNAVFGKTSTTTSSSATSFNTTPSTPSTTEGAYRRRQERLLPPSPTKPLTQAQRAAALASRRPLRAATHAAVNNQSCPPLPPAVMEQGLAGGGLRGKGNRRQNKGGTLGASESASAAAGALARFDNQTAWNWQV